MSGADSQEQEPARSTPVARHARPGEIDDRAVAALVAARAFVEIRYLAGRARREQREASTAEDLERIRFLADLCHNMPGIAQQPTRRHSRRNAPMSSRERAMAERPMSWIWNTVGPDGRAWILHHLDEAGYRWAPPPPLPTPRKGTVPLTLRQRLNLFWGWPVKTPPGKHPLPRQARVVKTVDVEMIHQLYEEASRLRLGLGKQSPWVRAHIDPAATHYLFPDPATYYWPDDERRWWQCRLLVRMIDGEQISNSLLAVLPETFIALPSTLPRPLQRRWAFIARVTERDSYLWSRDHKADCSPDKCRHASTEETPAT